MFLIFIYPLLNPIQCYIIIRFRILCRCFRWIFGVGGGWIVTPALNIFGFPMDYAIGTDITHIFGKS